MDWLDADLGFGTSASYPTLPKSMTNARAAKKRKHKEFYVSDDILDRAVRLKPLTGGHTGAACPSDVPKKRGAAKQQQPAHQTATVAAGSTIPGSSAAKSQEPGVLALSTAKVTWRQQLVQQEQPQPAPHLQPASTEPKPKRQKQRRDRPPSAEAEAAGVSAPALHQAPLQHPTTGGVKVGKRVKEMQAHQQKQQQPEHEQPQGRARPAAGGSALMDRMRARLAGGHFRQLNEQLYTSPGSEAFAVMQSDPQLFTAYHAGFKAQTQGWPVRPVDLAVSWLQRQPANWKVADFGCGDAELATLVKQDVASLDLVAAAPGVIACNMAATPLDAASQDATVFSLALMGTDYGSFLVEAARVLRPKGWLWLAEVRSRFTPDGGGSEDFGPFLECLKQVGFKPVSQDASNKMFVVMTLRKRRNAPATPPSGLQWPTLRPCVYKKR